MPSPSALAAPPRAARRSAPVPLVAGLATAAPPAVYEQERMLELLGLAGDPFATEIFGRCGVRRRHLGHPPAAWATTLQARTAATEAIIDAMAFDAVGRLAFDPDEIAVVVAGTYYGLGGPTLAHRLVDRLGLHPGTDKYHLLGVGCASAVPLLRMAAQALHDHPGGTALVVAAECVSGFLTPCAPGAPKVKVVGSSLFGDGCAAALVRLEETDGRTSAGGRAPAPAAAPAHAPRLLASAVHQLPGTLGEVRFAVSGEDSHMAMSRALPQIAAHGLAPLVDRFLADAGTEREQVGHWVAHPGGRGILDGLRAGLDLSEEQLAPSAAVLAEHGNVGTPSALFVLEQTHRMRDPQPGERGVMVTIGPGVTIGMALLEW